MIGPAGLCAAAVLLLPAPSAPAPPPLQEAYADRAVERLADPKVVGVPRLELMLERARSLLTWHIPSGLEVCREAADEARKQGRDEYVALALAMEARGLARTEGTAEASAVMQLARQTMPADAPVETRGLFCLIDVGLLYVIDEYGVAAETLDRCLELAEECGSQQLLADCLMELHDLLNVTDTGNDPLGDLRRAEAIFRDLEDRRGLLRTRLRYIDLWQSQGRNDEVESELQAIENEARSIGDRGTLLAVRSIRYDSALDADNFDLAVRLGQESLEISRSLGSDEGVAWALDEIAWAYLLGQRPDEAAPYVEQALTIAERMGLRGLEHAVLESAVELALARQDGPGLLAYSQRLAALARMELGQASRGEAQARIVLQELRRERRELNEAQHANEQRIVFYRWLAAGTAFLLLTALSVLFFVGKRRAERMHQRLVEQTELARRTEEDRKRLEEHLAQIERLDSIGLLSAGIAHDFNNILCCIGGNAELLLETSRGEEREMTDAILQASRRAGDLCTRLLDYARPSPANREGLDLRDLALEARTLLEVGGGSAALRLELGETAIPVEVDRSAIEQVLINLVTNAQDDGVGASQIVVAARTADGLEDAGEGLWFGHPESCATYAVLEVRDDGNGLNEAQLRRIFDPFYTTKFAGRGLGLSAAYGIVTSHGGAFHVTSRSPGGTTFAAYLPTTSPAEHREPEEPFEIRATAPRPTANPTRVLAVDDEPGILALVRESLSSQGHAVQVASSGPEAERILLERSASIDVVLLDLSMPTMDGRELLANLRRRGDSVPVIVMSGHGERFVRERVGNQDVDSILRKPFSKAELSNAIERATRSDSDVDRADRRHSNRA